MNYIQWESYTRSCVLSILLVWVLLVMPEAGHAQDTLDDTTTRSDLRINDDAGSAQQTYPRIATQSNGTSVVAWLDRRTGLHDIYFQKMTPTWFTEEKNKILVDSGAVGERFEVSLAASVNGQYCISWKDFRNGVFPFGADIYQKRLDQAGLPGPFEVSLTELESDSLYGAPDIALHTDGSGVTVWSQHHNNNWDIFALRFAADGSAIGSPFVVNSDASNAQQHAPRVSVSTLGWFVVSWYDNRKGIDNVFFQLYDSAGVEIGSNTHADIDADLKVKARQAFPAVACDGSGHFTLCWVDWRNGTYPSNPDIYIRRFTDSGVAKSDAERVAVDESSFPQKEPALATDRLGNVMVVWADSSFGGWDIYGRLIDHRGDFVAPRFLINADTLGRQVQPDVSMDGFDARIVWSDMRNGHFDIYGTQISYNDPSLVIDPSELDLSMHTTGPSPADVTIGILNAGLGQLIYEPVVTVDWLTVSKPAGLAPDSIVLSFDKDTLPVGSYYAEVLIIDHTNLDSSNVLTVSLSVTTSKISLPYDTLIVEAPTQLGAPPDELIIPINTGSGTLSWTAEESTTWLSLSRSSGGAGDSVSISFDVTGLGIDEHIGAIVFTDTLASNSPETLFVALRYFSDIPFLGMDSDTLIADLSVGAALDTAFRVRNFGGGALSWSASSSDSWIRLNSLGGVDNDSLSVTLDATELGPGLYTGWVIISDDGAANNPLPLAISLNVTASDTLVFSDVSAEPSESFEIVISLIANDQPKEMRLDLILDTMRMQYDSVTLMDSVNQSHELDAKFDTALGVLQMSYASVDPLAEPLVDGEYGLLVLHLTSTLIEFSFTSEQLLLDPDSALFGYNGGLEFTAPIRHGSIRVGISTSVEEELVDPVLPLSLEVGQNYPNPFNAEMKFQVSFAKASEARVRVFNILGQSIRTIFSGPVAPGGRIFAWDGKLEAGRVAPSGMYLYQVQVGDESIIRKAMLVK